MPNLNSTIDFDLKKFFRWWLGELDFLVPEKIRQLINEKHGFFIVRPDNGRFSLSYFASGKEYTETETAEPLAMLERNESGISQFQALQTKDERFAKAYFVLRLSTQEAIQKELSLPAAVKENLAQVIAYELDRYTPFTPEQVYFAVKNMPGENEPGLLRVMLIITPKETLDALCEDIKAFGMSLLFADYEAAPNSLEHRYDGYNLLPENFREKTATTPRLVYSALAAGILLLLTTMMIMPIWFEQRAVDALDEKISVIEKEARGVKTLQQEIDAIIDETKLLIAEKNAAPDVTDMLNTLSSLIKDDTWLNYLRYSDGNLQIQGESPSASALIAILEESPMFANVKFSSPVTQDKASGLERFQINADVVPPSSASSGDAND